jgi:hypothetical protein
MSKILKQIKSDDIGLVYRQVTDIATSWVLCGFVDEANALLEKLWSLNLEHDRNTWLNDDAFDIVWSITNKAPLKIPFVRKNANEIQAEHWERHFLPYWNDNEAYAERIKGKDWSELSGNDLLLAGISLAYDYNSKNRASKKEGQLNSLNAITKYLKTVNPVGHSLMNALLCAATVAARNDMRSEAEGFLIQWGENYKDYWSNTFISYPLRDIALAKILLSGILAPTFNLTKEKCKEELEEISRALDERISKGQSLAYEKLKWKDLLKYIAKKAVEKGDYEGKVETLTKRAVKKEEIEDAEKRLGIKLPKEYKDFLLVSNGLESFGLNPTLHDVSKIDWLKKLDPQMVEIWTGSMGEIDKKFAESFSNSLLIGGHHEEQQLLLIPSKKSKDWECWFFASWVPGETKYPNFRYYMEDKLQNLDSD